MAKNPTLTLDVKDQKYKDFVKSFNELTAKMTAMNQKWKDLSKSIKETADSINSVNSTMRTAGQHIAQFGNSAIKITKSIAKWGGMIGGIITLLGGGAWFGMDKMAQRMVDARRRLMGLGGGDYGKTQAIETFGKGLLDDPKAVEANIARGKSGLGDEHVALGIAHITDQEIRTKKTQDLLMEYVQHVAKIRDEGPGMLERARARNETSILSEADIIRLHSKEGPAMVEMLQKRFDAAKGLTDADLKAWEQFWESVTNFKNKMDTEWLKALEPLAPAGSKFIEALTNLTTKLMAWETASGEIQNIAKGLQWIADFLENPSWKKAWEGFEDILLKFLGIDKSDDRFTPTGAAQSIQKKAAQFNLGTRAPTAPSTSSPSFNERFGSWEFGQKTPVPFTSGNVPGMPATAPAGGGGAASFIQRFGGTSGGGGGLPWWVSPGSTDSGGGGNRTKFSSAAQSMMPGSRGGAITSLANTMLAGLDLGGAGGGGQGGGPLNMNNWQSNRTASLTIRGVPSANLFVAATGMAG